MGNNISDIQLNNAVKNLNKINAYNIESMKQEKSECERQLRFIQNEINQLNEKNKDKEETYYNSNEYKEIDKKIKYLTLQTSVLEEAIAEYETGLIENGEV